MKKYDLIVIGAGPAGLSAAVEGAKAGMHTVVFDENAKPGGQLFKQIHKFFGSKEHHAKERGFRIGEQLLKEAEAAGAEISLNSTVTGIFPGKKVTVKKEDHMETVQGGSLIVATGASERMIPFEGWTLPGVMGAGAAQTMMNLYGVVPGQRVLMVGSGNVGLVVSYQLLQAGCEVVAVIDAAPKIGGYGVHAAKVARTGVPFLLSHTVVKAEGTDHVESVVIGEVDSSWKVIPGSEKKFDVDVICVAVGLTPMSRLIRMTGVKTEDKGGTVPSVDEVGATDIPGIFAAGDVSGIEEASSAMIEGRIAALAAARYEGYLSDEKFEQRRVEEEASLSQLRQGMFAIQNRGKKLTHTEEGCPLSQSLLKKGHLTSEEVKSFPGYYSKPGTVHPVMECTQNIPCNPCQDACKFGCIHIGEHITTLPVVDHEKDCKNCGMCVASCSGQAIFLLDEREEDGCMKVTLPYEFLPLPKPGDEGIALDRSGKPVCPAVVTQVRTAPGFDKTALLTMKVPSAYIHEARFYKKACEGRKEA